MNPATFTWHAPLEVLDGHSSKRHFSAHGSKGRNTGTSSREGTGHQRLRLAPLAVRSPAPRLAAAQKGQEKMAKTGAFSRPKSAILSYFGALLLNTTHWLGCLYVDRLSWRP
jgi:hypothetical protein